MQKIIFIIEEIKKYRKCPALVIFRQLFSPLHCFFSQGLKIGNFLRLDCKKKKSSWKLKIREKCLQIFTNPLWEKVFFLHSVFSLQQQKKTNFGSKKRSLCCKQFIVLLCMYGYCMRQQNRCRKNKHSKANSPELGAVLKILSGIRYWAMGTFGILYSVIFQRLSVSVFSIGIW